MDAYYKKKEPSTTEYELATQEGSFAYHTIQHNHSFRSMDCSSSMIRNFYQQKFTCAITKCEAIVKNVFAPWALELVSQDLIKADAIALSIDTSNHGHLKLLPILARFYNHESNEIATKLIDFVDVKGETAEIISSGGRSRAHLVKHSRSHMTYNLGVVTESDHEIFLARKTCVFLSESQEEVRALVQQLFIANRV